MAVSDVVKLRVKVGVHELEAEGARDWVETQLEAWKRLAGLGAANEPKVTRRAALLRREQGPRGPARLHEVTTA